MTRVASDRFGSVRIGSDWIGFCGQNGRTSCCNVGGGGGGGDGDTLLTWNTLARKRVHVDEGRQRGRRTAWSLGHSPPAPDSIFFSPLFFRLGFLQLLLLLLLLLSSQ